MPISTPSRDWESPVGKRLTVAERVSSLLCALFSLCLKLQPKCSPEPGLLLVPTGQTGDPLGLNPGVDESGSLPVQRLTRVV